MKKGFTLIELLIVIAIIGILTAVILPNVNGARNKSNNAVVQEDLAGIRTQAETFYDDNNTYVGACASANISAQLDNATLAATGTTTTSATVCNEATNAFAVSSALKSPMGANGYWCVDTTGIATSEPAALGAGVTVCP